MLELEDKNFIKNIIIFLLNNKKSMIHIRRCRIQVSYMDISIGVTMASSSSCPSHIKIKVDPIDSDVLWMQPKHVSEHLECIRSSFK